MLLSNVVSVFVSVSTLETLVALTSAVVLHEPVDFLYWITYPLVAALFLLQFTVNLYG